MAFDFPQFTEPTPIDGKRSWTARYVSYDQRNEDVYYFVTVREGDHEVAQFMVQVSLYWAGDDWNVPTFLPHLRKDIGDAAAVGKTNTSYTGA